MTTPISPRLTFCGLFAAAALILGVSAAPAAAGVEWRVTSTHGATNMAPGDSDPTTAEGQYVIQAFNIGDTASSSGATIVDTLPPGVTATTTTTVPANNSNWKCPGAAGSSVVTCTRTGAIQPAGPEAFSAGAAPTLFITVSVAPTAAGTAANAVAISGGGSPPCGGPQPPCPAVVDPTTFSSIPTGFGMVAGSFTADLFDAQFPSAGTPVRQAGSHPFEMRVDFNMNLKLSTNPADGTTKYTEPEGRAHTLETRLPPGFVGNPEATPRCPGVLLGSPGATQHGSCPASTQVGTMDLVLQNGKIIQAVNALTRIPVYNVVPPGNEVAAFALTVLGNPVYILASLNPTNHSVVTRIESANTLLPLREAHLRLWGVPADPAHDVLRVNGDAPDIFTAYGAASDAPIVPLLTLSSQCDTAASIQQRVSSWQNPEAFSPWQSGASIQPTGCEDPRIRFKPSITIQPTSHEAASPTGLDIDLSVPQKDDTVAVAGDLYAQSGKDAAIATPNLKDAVTHLPLGMAVNPSVADGLGGCSEGQVGLDNNEAPACPDNSKIGTVEIDSPMVPDTLKGSVYQAKPFENPSNSLLAFYTVARGDGLTIKLAAKVQSDPETGQLTTTFTDNPQLSFSHYRLHFNGGPRAPLVNPPTCGSYEATAHFTAWNSSVPAVDTGDTSQITSGPNGTPCPDGLAGRPFAPAFKAGSQFPIAGAFSPFALEASRADGTQELRSIETTLPPGMIGKLAGISYCPESAIAQVSSQPGTGLGERLHPSCPAASLIGHTDAAAGAGSLPFHNPGNVYLSGPRNGAPLSLALVTPVIAGPLDLGSIVVRADLRIDPITAQVHVASDPIPEKIVAAGNGFPLNVRSVRVTMDRDRFTLNPTSCDPMSVAGTIGSLQGASAAVTDRFQVGACAALPFKPKLSLKLKGATHRSEDPALRATLTMPPGSANIARASVALPHSEFLDQAHIRTVCTRVQFAAEACPAGSVYGHARAFTPLLDQPLEGPVYLRSSDNPLPDLVADLRGQIHIVLDGRIDSKDEGIRTTFATVPDAPVSKFVLTMKGGKRGLLENSADLCARPHRATVQMDAHNGKIGDSRPLVRTSCGKARP